MADQVPQTVGPIPCGGIARDDERRPLGALGRATPCPLGRDPTAAGDEALQRLGGGGDEPLAQRRREVTAAERLADLAVRTEPLDDADLGHLGQGRAVVAAEHQHGVARSHFGQRARDRHRQRRSRRDGALHRRLAERRRVDQFGVREQRRARQDRDRDIGLIVRERGHEMVRGIDRRRQSLGERPSDERRRIVEQAGHGPLHLALLDAVELGIEIGVGQCPRSLGPLAGGRAFSPGKELPAQHG